MYNVTRFRYYNNIFVSNHLTVISVISIRFYEFSKFQFDFIQCSKSWQHFEFTYIMEAKIKLIFCFSGLNCFEFTLKELEAEIKF